MAFLAGKKILVTGLLSNRSIAYGIAKAAQREGAELAFTYQNERFKDRVTEMARELGSKIAIPCEVTSDSEISSLFQELTKQWDGLDGLVHAIAFAPREAIAGDFLDGMRDQIRGQLLDLLLVETLLDELRFGGPASPQHLGGGMPLATHRRVQ